MENVFMAGDDVSFFPVEGDNFGRGIQFWLLNFIFLPRIYNFSLTYSHIIHYTSQLLYAQIKIRKNHQQQQL